MVTIQCLLCDGQTDRFIKPAEIPSSIHAILGVLCPKWANGAGFCCSCVESLTQGTEALARPSQGPAPGNEYSQATPQFTLTEREFEYWTHRVDSVRAWFRAELRAKAVRLAQENNQLNWRIVDPRGELLKKGVTKISLRRN